MIGRILRRYEGRQIRRLRERYSLDVPEQTIGDDYYKCLEGERGQLFEDAIGGRVPVDYAADVIVSINNHPSLRIRRFFLDIADALTH